jgi:DNA-directed RNA polymerase specialized sigma subunit
VSYRVVVTREGSHWLADVPELEGAHTFANSLRKLDQYVREVVAMAADLPDEAMPELEFEYEYQLGNPALDERVRRIRQDRALLEQIRQRLEEDREGVIGLAFATGGEPLSQRDIAEIIGLSHQRVSQIAGG